MERKSVPTKHIMRLQDLSTEALSEITSYAETVGDGIIKLWQCGSRTLNTKLMYGGVTRVNLCDLRAHSNARWPECVYEMRQLQSLIVRHDSLNHRLFMDPTRLSPTIRQLHLLFKHNYMRVMTRWDVLFPNLEDFGINPLYEIPYDGVITCAHFSSLPQTITRLFVERQCSQDDVKAVLSQLPNLQEFNCCGVSIKYDPTTYRLPSSLTKYNALMQWSSELTVDQINALPRGLLGLNVSVTVLENNNTHISFPPVLESLRVYTTRSDLVQPIWDGISQLCQLKLLFANLIEADAFDWRTILPPKLESFSTNRLPPQWCANPTKLSLDDGTTVMVPTWPTSLQKLDVWDTDTPVERYSWPPNLQMLRLLHATTLAIQLPLSVTDLTIDANNMTDLYDNSSLCRSLKSLRLYGSVATDLNLHEFGQLEIVQFILRSNMLPSQVILPSTLKQLAFGIIQNKYILLEDWVAILPLTLEKLTFPTININADTPHALTLFPPQLQDLSIRFTVQPETCPPTLLSTCIDALPRALQYLHMSISYESTSLAQADYINAFSTSQLPKELKSLVITDHYMSRVAFDAPMPHVQQLMILIIDTEGLRLDQLFPRVHQSSCNIHDVVQIQYPPSAETFIQKDIELWQQHQQIQAL